MKKYLKKRTKADWYRENPGYNNAANRRWYHANKEQSREIQYRWRKNNPESWKRTCRNHALRQYGLTESDYQKLSKKSKGMCWACKGKPTGRWKKLQVDHCHRTDKIRGLLCLNCNAALGLLQDSQKRLFALVRYLKCASKMEKKLNDLQ